jgi:hypothetical protein
MELLGGLTVATPCTADWDAMSGDDRARFCLQCRRHVYNLSAMKAAEAVALIREKEGALCVRLYRRIDGTVMTADCPVGLRTIIRQPWHILLIPAALTIAVLGVIWNWYSGDNAEHRRPGVTEHKRPCVIMGEPGPSVAQDDPIAKPPANR